MCVFDVFSMKINDGIHQVLSLADMITCTKYSAIYYGIDFSPSEKITLIKKIIKKYEREIADYLSPSKYAL